MPRTQPETTPPPAMTAPPKEPKAAAVATEPTEGVFPRHLTKGRGWVSTLAQEQIHVLATHVLARHSEQGLRTLAVTSAVAGEGKTTVTLALGEKLASASKRILVIDLDTHRATLSLDAGLDGMAGAIEATQAPRGSAMPFHIYPTDVPGVSIMPAGGLGLNGDIPLLDPPSLHNLIQRGLEDHDLVLLDCPPLLPVADTHVIAEAADSALLVVRAGSTPREVLEQALTAIGKEKFFAAILNRAQPHLIPYFSEVYGYYRRDPAPG